MLDKKLLDYIKQNKKQGFSDDEIRKALLETGWNRGDVEEGFKKKSIFKNKKIRIIGLIIIVLIGGFFIFREEIEDFYFFEIVHFEPLENWRLEKIYNEYDEISREYNVELMDEMKTINWKKFEKQYFSFDYPENWDLEDTTDSDRNKVSLVLRSPKVDTPYLDKWWGKTKYMSTSLYLMSFRVFSPQQYDDDPIIQTVINDEDLNGFLDTMYLNGLGMDKAEIFTLNGKEGILELTGNENIFYGGKLYFLTGRNIIEIRFIDFTQFPISQIIETDTNLFNLIKDKPYYKIIESIQIKSDEFLE